MVNTWDRGDGHNSVFSFFQVLHKNQGRKTMEGKEEKRMPEPSPTHKLPGEGGMTRQLWQH
jgi:hypothetical protein